MDKKKKGVEVFHVGGETKRRKPHNPRKTPHSCDARGEGGERVAHRKGPKAKKGSVGGDSSHKPQWRDLSHRNQPGCVIEEIDTKIARKMKLGHSLSLCWEMPVTNSLTRSLTGESTKTNPVHKGGLKGRKQSREKKNGLLARVLQLLLRAAVAKNKIGADHRSTVREWNEPTRDDT